MPEVHPTLTAYMQHNNSVQGLVVLCQGLKSLTGEDLINIDNDPWKAMPREDAKPKAKMFREEVIRRHQVLNLTCPKPRSKNWTIEKCQQWLDENPITNHDEIEYLQEKIKEHKEIQEEANKARLSEIEALEKNWVGKFPYLRLIHCLVDDDTIKHAYLRRNDIDDSRISLDNRNSDTRGQTVFDLLADRWNDPLFEPETEALPDLHPDFSFSEILTFDLVADMAKATPQRVKDKLQSLNVALTRVINMWERSGQGDGGRVDDGDDECEDIECREFGHPDFSVLQDRNHGALSCRSAFVPNNQSYLLYFWELMDKHDLLRSSFQKLNHGTASSDGGSSVPSVTHNSNNRESKSDAKTAKYIDKLTVSIEELANKNLQAASMTARETKKDREQRNRARYW